MQCPRSLWTEARSFLWTSVVRRGRNNCWKYRQILLMPCWSLPHLVLVVGESPTAQSAEQIVEIPVPSGDLQGSRPGHSFRCALLSRSLTFQFRVVVGGWCRSSRFSPSTASSSSPGAVDEAFHGFFRTFPRFQKSAESGRQCGDDGSCRSRRALQLMDVGGF